MPKINLKIITPEKLVYEGVVSEFYAFTQTGKIGVLPMHVPLVTVLKPGEMIIKKDGVDLPMAVSGGILEVRPSLNISGEFVTPVVILVDHLEFAQDIDLEKSKAAYERAKKAMEEKSNLLDVDFARLQAKIEKELNRVKIGSKYRK